MLNEVNRIKVGKQVCRGFPRCSSQQALHVGLSRLTSGKGIPYYSIDRFKRTGRD
jgi:hypothetical protein